MASEGAAATPPPPEEDGAASPEETRARLVAHIAAVAPALLGEGAAADVEAAARDGGGAETLSLFVTDASTPLLLVQHVQGRGFTFRAAMGVEPTKAGSQLLAFVRAGEALDARPMAEQMQVVQVSDKAPFQTILSYVRNCFLPYSRALIQGASEAKSPDDDAAGGNKTDDVAVVRGVSAKLGELEVELLKSQQSVDIPTVQLELHPKIADFVASKGGAGLDVDDFGDLGSDDTFLNEVQKGIGGWKRQILAVTNKTHDVYSGTTISEISFWTQLSARLQDVDQQLAQAGVQFTFTLLKQRKRFHLTTGFNTEIGLTRAKETVQKYCELLRDFPVRDLLAAPNLEDVKDAVTRIFGHLKQVKRVEYPLDRTIGLVHAVSRDVAAQVRGLLNPRALMSQDYESFDKAVTPISKVFRAWDNGQSELASMLRDLKKSTRRNDSIERLSDAHEELERLKRRVTEVHQLRRQHDGLERTIGEALGADAFEREAAFEQLKSAYEHVRQVDVLDTTGEAAWSYARGQYDQVIDSVDKDLESRIRDMLADAKNDSNELFRVCAKFNPLFDRQRIKSAIREYQELLIETVKRDIEGLQNRYRDGSNAKEALRMSELRDVPRVSGTIIRAKQTERQLDLYMERIKAVLGAKWENNVEGKRLKTECDTFRNKLQPKPVFDKWVDDAKQLADAASADDNLIVYRVVTSTHGEARLEVNFDRRLISLFKEVRILSHLDYLMIPYPIRMAAAEAKHKYPYAMRLEEVARMFMRTSNQLDRHARLAPLAATFKRDVQEIIKKCVRITWESEKLEKYVNRLGTAAVNFQDKVDELVTQYEGIRGSLRALEACKPTRQNFRRIVADIQEVVDRLDKGGFSNLGGWVAELDREMEQLLVERLREVINLWVQALDHAPGVYAERQRARAAAAAGGGLVMDDAAAAAAVAAAAATAGGAGAGDGSAPPATVVGILDFVMEQPSSHEVSFRDQMVQVSPPLEGARLALAGNFQGWLSSVLELPRLNRFWGGGDGGPGVGGTFRSALTQLSPDELARPFRKIEEVVGQAQAYVGTWLAYQSLWDMDPETVVAEMGDDLPRWESLLLDMKRSRSTFDSSDTYKMFGPVLVDYGLIQGKVNDKYDAWQKTVLSAFGKKVAEMQHSLHASLGSSRKELENVNLDFGTTEEIVASVTLLLDLESKAAAWRAQLDAHANAEHLLKRQRYLFPGDWLDVERVTNEFGALEQLLGAKLAKLKEATPAIQATLAEEEMRLADRVKETVEEWQRDRPVQGDLDHRKVSATLGLFSGKVERLKTSMDQLNRAKEAMGLPVKRDDRLEPMDDELRGLQDVWSELGKVWGSLDEMRGTLFREVKALDVRRGLSSLEKRLKNLPRNMHHYGAFEHLKKTIADLAAMNVPMFELASGVLRPKHHKILLKEIGIQNVSWHDLTLGVLWERDLKSHLKAIRYVLEQAQGESALEEFLLEVQQIWENFRLELVDYRSKCFLIRNWDPLFMQLNDHLSDLASMRQSPFFAAFEREANEWDAVLNNGQAVFDVFIDVQRRWVYLEGIFNSSQDVQEQLAYQFKRFRTFDRDFVKLMREIKRDPSALYWINAERNLLPRMESYADTLTGIQKALGDYLERQRAAFPRFYFVGDEDLLEIIGNAKNPVKVQRHLPKMFAGVSSLRLSENGMHVHGMESREGESVTFPQPVSVAESTNIQGWLSQVESQMRVSLATLLAEAVRGAAALGTGASFDAQRYFEWVDKYPAQIALMSTQVSYSESVDAALAGGGGAKLDAVVAAVEKTLGALADRILTPGLEALRRKKYEHLITELVHQRDVGRDLSRKGVSSNADYEWCQQMRFYFSPAEKDVMKRLEIRMSRAAFHYGFEYLGVGERLVQTPLTDRCYLTLCEALHMRMGGNPFGPAGTGKTETVKALGSLLGRFVLVFNCDERFDFKSVGRILIGLCQCGAWGCFDEFNRLEERILSAVSQQILTIQTGLRNGDSSVRLLERDVNLDSRMGMFVTMNPGYAGRSNLPDNLKQLFRGIAMIKPDWGLIGQVMLFSQGFREAEDLSGKVVLLFQLCSDQLSDQPHYDFGLRALKSVLRSAGAIKRGEVTGLVPKDGGEPEEAKSGESEPEILIRSICETVVPKLVAGDGPLFGTLMKAVFPQAEVTAPMLDKLRAVVSRLCKERRLLDEPRWMDKVMQLCQIQSIHHGVIMVGPAGNGKSTAWKTLIDALEEYDGVKSERYVIDPKSMTKDQLYGVLDPTTLEWTDGVFTHILRKIIDNQRGEAGRRHWIVFDGDVDPEWAENLNSVLDDNKLLTLPNGERLALSSNVRIMFEVKDLRHATPATVSRCGMVWFSEDVVSTRMVMYNALEELRHAAPSGVSPGVYNRWKGVQQEIVDAAGRYFEGGTDEQGALRGEGQESSFATRVLEYAATRPHVMPFTYGRALATAFSLLRACVAKAIEYNDNHPDFPLAGRGLETYTKKYVAYALLWGAGGDMSLENRLAFCDEMHRLAPGSLPLPDKGTPLIDFEIRVDSQEWEQWQDRIDAVEIEPHKIVAPDMVIETVDTARHTDIVGSWLADHRPLILCGPPGSGKSMTLVSVLNNNPSYEQVVLNFSSTTTPDLLLRTFDQYCKVERTPTGPVMRPADKNRWLVIFCDEINLPANDLYETQHVITFIRQLTEQGGFWRPSDMTFVQLDRVQVIGACNPPTDAGRVAMTERFLRHCPLLFVDFPAEPSLRQIYGTFNRALLKLTPSLRAHAEPLTSAMIEFYQESQRRFTPENQPHYIYSPRELSRWVRAMYEAMAPIESMTLEDLVRLWLHEALRLFQDRLVERAERDWTDELGDRLARKHFKQVNAGEALARPILFSNWLTKKYVSVQQEALREHVIARLHVFNEEELDVKLVIFDEVLEHILRIDRVLRQPIGHMLLVGASGSGKTILSKFVAWMNGMSPFQIKVHNKYSTKDFDKDLRAVLTRAGARDEKICFIFDESNVLNTAFLERMNALLASGEVPGLFEGAEFKALMQECKEAARRDGVMIESEGELLQRFNTQVQRNLHVVFTMNPSNDDFDNRSATSPALFNRCVIDWFGEWSHEALEQVGFEFTRDMDLGDAADGGGAAPDDEDPESAAKRVRPVPGSRREAVVQSLVYVHESVHEAMEHMARQKAGRSTYVTPRHFLDLIKHYQKLHDDKEEQLQDQQRHLNQGLRQLVDTEEQVLKLRGELTIKQRDLETKTRAANEKLEQMLQGQSEAEQKRDASVKLGEEMKVKEEQIEKRRAEVSASLSEAEPALRDAEQSVSGIKVAQLNELRAYPKPPPLVKLALEPIMMLLRSPKPTDWASTKTVLRSADFINRILNFDSATISDGVRRKIERDYASNPDFTYERISKASKACGPLAKWVKSQLAYAGILLSIEPLQNEMKGLESEAEELTVRQEELVGIVSDLQDRIAGYKTEYAALISEAETIKQEMQSVKAKVDRSMGLIENLGVERERWERDAEGFKDQMSTVVGDSLICAGFLAYIGIFNQAYRRLLVDKWTEELTGRGVQCKEDLSVVDYLSHPTERLEWQANKLPDDVLCIENAIMIKKFNRYPLIIDPSGQATDFLMEHYKERKIIRTSFLDDGFLKHLEAALRFGNALLVEDVESMDPVLNSVLNREISRTGGRVMITLGDKEIDFSPSFTIFLATRDPTTHFTPDLCSRVTFVNFTITHSSLTTQCLGKVLKAERPDIDRKRTDWLKLQGEFRVRLRQLEEQVLEALSGVEGNILDDDKVMASLEKLKNEAGEVTRKMAASDEVLDEIESVSALYRPFALACSHFYFTLENLSGLEHLYQYSLSFFLAIVDAILFGEARVPASVEGEERRLAELQRALMFVGYERVARGLMQRDQTTFALRLAQVYLAAVGRPLDEDEVDFLLKSKLDDSAAAAVPEELGLGKAQRMMLGQLVSLPAFSELGPHLRRGAAAWKAFADPSCDRPAPDDPEHHHASRDKAFTAVPGGWEKSGSDQARLFHWLLVCKVVRPDLFPAAADAFVSSVFGDEFIDQTVGFDLGAVAEHQMTCRTPLLLVSRPGYDASTRIDALAAASGRRQDAGYQSFAMGSEEGYALADAAIRRALKTGGWVLLKNVHMSPAWLNRLEKALHLALPHAEFRLFMTMEFSDRVPVNLLRMSHVLILEPPVGIKNSLLRTFGSLDPARVDKAPVERGRLFFLLAWLHAVVLERLRYAPVGWTKAFEFSESDLHVAMDAVDEWVDRTSRGRANLSPDKIPWGALRSLMEVISYGGRVDNAFDQRRLEAFVRTLFSPAAYGPDFALCHTVDADTGATRPLVSMPDAKTHAAFLAFVRDMGDVKNPELLGLPANAELMLLTAQARHMTASLTQLQESGADVTPPDASELRRRRSSVALSAADAGALPPWMTRMEGHVSTWLRRVQSDLPSLPRTAKSINDPLFRSLEREVVFWAELLRRVMDDLSFAQRVLTGQEKPNNPLRQLLENIRRDRVPPHWERFVVEDRRITPFVHDLALRSELLRKLCGSSPEKLGRTSFWLGGLRNPEAFLASTRQAVAQANSWSLEEMELDVSGVGDRSDPGDGPDCFVFTGFTLFGGSWKDGLALTNTVSFEMPPLRFTWVRRRASSEAAVDVPVYLNSSRRHLLFTVRMRVASTDVPAVWWNQRGTCLTVWRSQL